MKPFLISRLKRFVNLRGRIYGYLIDTEERGSKDSRGQGLKCLL